MRQIFLDTETTGFNPTEGDRIIEIGAVELVKRKLTGNNYHQFINPERPIPAEATQVHGITDQQVANEPKFAEIVDAFMEYVAGAELIIHNAPFDVGFINHELFLLANNRWGKIEDHCTINDSLKLAQKHYPGQRNSLDALCKRLNIDNTARVFHGALLDSEILADVYLAMTGGQVDLGLSLQSHQDGQLEIDRQAMAKPRTLTVLSATPDELQTHQAKLAEISEKSGKHCIW